MRASPPLPKPLPSPPLLLLRARSPLLTAPLLPEGAESEESSGEADREAEAWGLADVRELHPGLLAHRAARTRDLPALAAALAHGAEVNWADAEDEGKTPLVQAVLGVSGAGAARRTQVHADTGINPLLWRVGRAPSPPLEIGSVPAGGGGSPRGLPPLSLNCPDFPGLLDRL